MTNLVDLQINDMSYSIGSSLKFEARGIVRARDRWVIQGPSGCGKSSFLRALAGLLPLDSGTVSLGAQVLSDLPPFERRCGFVFQSGALFLHLNVLENLLFGMKNFFPDLSDSLMIQKAREMLDRFELINIEQRDVSSLSGGERQRIALARVLLCEPQYLLLDEPLSAVDAGAREKLQRLIVTLHEERPIPLIAVTHDLSEAQALGTQCIQMKVGERCLEFAQ